MISRSDERTLAQLRNLLERMSEDELCRFVEGTMNALIVADVILQRRFPDRHKAWVKELEGSE